MDRERCDALDLSGLTPEIIRNWVQLQKVTGNIDNKVRALVAPAGCVRRAASAGRLVEGPRYAGRSLHG